LARSFLPQGTRKKDREGREGVLADPLRSLRLSALDAELVPTQLADNVGDAVFLEKANSGDASGSGFKTGECVLERDASQCEHWNVVLARLVKEGESRRFAVGDGSFLKDRGEKSHVGSGGCGLFNLRGLVARQGDRDAGWGDTTHTTLLPDLADL
jgi:hypothetical protein